MGQTYTKSRVALFLESGQLVCFDTIPSSDGQMFYKNEVSYDDSFIQLWDVPDAGCPPVSIASSRMSAACVDFLSNRQ